MTYYGANKQQYQLNDIPIKKGGEGAIHTVQGKSNLLAKIYLAPAKSPELKEKISLMVKNPPRKDILDQIAWPIDTLSDAGGNFVGFVMPKLSIDVELGDVYKYPAKKNITLTGEQKVIIAINICRVISAIHDLDYVFGDFNPCNIGVNLTNGHVAFLDTDSYHITDKTRGKTYRCNVCLNGYVAPELIKKCKNVGYAQAPLPTFTKETDLFSLAIHVFKLLMNGFTPYNGIPENERSSTASPGVGNAAIEMDHYCFKAGNRPLSVAVLPLQAFPNDIRELFTRAFDTGHQNPSKRPSAKEWDAVLTNYHSNLKKCNANPMHYHYKGLQSCPYCEADQRYTYTMSMSSVYGTSSTSSSGQMSFSQPMTPPPSPPPSNNYSSSNTYQSSSGSSQYSGSVFSGSSSSARVSQRSTNGFASKKLPRAIIITVLAVVLIVGGYFGITTAINNSKIDKVESLISELPTDENYYLDYQAEIVDAYAAYMELDEKLRDKVENADKLMTIMEGLKVAEAYEQRQNMQFTELESGGYSVKLKEGANSKISGELIIPSVYRQQPVVSIEDYAFENCRNITSVVVPDSIITIGIGAFKGCNNIKNMTLPFTGKSNDATAHEAVFGYIFGYDTQRDSNASGTDFTFNNKQYGTASGTWQYTYKESGYNYSCFYHIPMSVTSVTITNQSRIPAAVFNGCMYIESVSYLNAEEISTIEEAAFQNCLALQSFNGSPSGVLNISSNITEIKYKAFYKCSKFVSITFENGIRQIGNYAFQECDKITTLTIPNSVTNIGVGAFNGCNKLVDVSLPFTGASATAEHENAVFGYIFGYDTQRDSNASGTNHAFKNMQYGTIAGGTWQYTYIQSGYNYSCFYYIPTSLTSVTISNQSRVPAAVFNGCIYIQNIVYTKANEITTIEEAAFQNCLALKKLNNADENNLIIPSSVMDIKYKAFYKCSKFKSVTFPEGLREIGEYAFQECGEFSTLVIPNTVTNLGRGAFMGCNKLTTVSLPFTGASATAEYENAVFGYIFGYDTQRDSNASGTNHAFKNTQYGTVAGGTWQYTYIQSGYNYSCFYYIPTTITSVTITNQSRIPAAVFNGCQYIKSITYSKANEISTVEEAAFQNCLALEVFNGANTGVLNIPSSVVEIKYKAFYKCSKFESINFEVGLRQIGNYAFQECSEFTELTIPDSVTNIGLGAFNGCNKLVKVSLPFTGESATAEYENAVFGYIFGYDTQRDSNASGTNHTFKNKQYGTIAGGTWQYTYIQSGYNYSCFYYIPTSISSVTITNQKKVPSAAFNGCVNITQITYSLGISTEGDAAFQNCTATIIK